MTGNDVRFSNQLLKKRNPCILMVADTRRNSVAADMISGEKQEKGYFLLQFRGDISKDR